MKRRVFILSIATLFAALAFSACTTRSKARAGEQAAFRAGQQQGAISEKARQNGVTFKGPVMNEIVPWTEKLTLAQAIVAAQWVGKGDPRQIIITHGEERMAMSAADVLEGGGNLQMQPGDTVELVP